MAIGSPEKYGKCLSRCERSVGWRPRAAGGDLFEREVMFAGRARRVALRLAGSADVVPAFREPAGALIQAGADLLGDVVVPEHVAQRVDPGGALGHGFAHGFGGRQNGHPQVSALFSNDRAARSRLVWARCFLGAVRHAKCDAFRREYQRPRMSTGGPSGHRP